MCHCHCHCHKRPDLRGISVESGEANNDSIMQQDTSWQSLHEDRTRMSDFNAVNPDVQTRHAEFVQCVLDTASFVFWSGIRSQDVHVDLLHITHDCWKEVADEARLEQHEPSPRDDIEPRSPVRGGRGGEVEPTSPVPRRSLLVLVMPVNVPTMPTMPTIATSSTQTHVSGWCLFVILGTCRWQRRMGVFFAGDWRPRCAWRARVLDPICDMMSCRRQLARSHVQTTICSTGSRLSTAKVCSGNIVSLSEQQFVDDSGCTGGLVGHAFSFARTIAA